MGAAVRRSHYEWRDYGSVCWWCGNEADSREHKYKRSDIVSQFGSGPYRDVVRGQEGDSTWSNVQGPDSKWLKFEKNLCSVCNNSASQPYDQAYECVMQYVNAHSEVILSSHALDFAAIDFRDGWRALQTRMIGYLVKHAACRLAEARVEVPKEYVDFLDNRRKISQFGLSAVIRTDVLAMHETVDVDGSLWVGGLGVMLGRQDGTVRSAHGHYGVGWLWFYWQCSPEIPRWSPAGARWPLPTHANVDPRRFQDGANEPH